MTEHAPTAQTPGENSRRRLPFTGLVPLGLGVVALTGWSTGWMVLASFPGAVPMMPLTAAGMIAAGSAIVLLLTTGVGAEVARRRLGFVLSLATLAVGVASLLGVTLPDAASFEALFAEGVREVGLPKGGWPAPNTAVLFVAAGLGLLTGSLKGQWRGPVLRISAAVTAMVALSALVGHVYGLGWLYGLASSTPMAFLTALGFLVLAAGIAFLDPDRWLAQAVDPRHGGGLLAQRLLPAVLLVPLVVGGIALVGARLELYDVAFAVAIVVVATVVVLTLVVGRSALTVRQVELERTRSVLALQQSEERFRALAENAQEAIVTIDQDNRVVFANPGIERILGYPPDDLVGESFSILVPDRLRAAHERGFARYLATSERRLPWDGVELPGRHRDGHEVPLEITFSEYLKGDRHLFTGIMRDVTERHETAERQRFLIDAGRALSSSLDPLEVLRRVADLAVPSLADWCAVDLVDADGTLGRGASTHAEPERLREVESLDWSTLSDPDAPLGAVAVVRTGEPELYADVGSGDDGGASPHFHALRQLGLHSVMVVPMYGNEGVLGAITLATTRAGVHYDEGDLAFAGQLGALAGIAVQNSRLHHATEQARGVAERRTRDLERVSESRARLIRGFTHDVKNPLGAADGFAALLLEGVHGEISQEQRQTLERLRKNIGVAASLIADLLELARAESGQIDLQVGAVDLGEAVRELAEAYSAQARAKGLDIHVDLPGDLPPVRSDPKRVRQILDNLVSNAVKYTSDGGVRLGARAEGGWLVAEVEDTGEGIPEDQIPLLFQEFSRLHPDGAEGAGLGLAIARQLAGALGGEVRVESELGRGSCFSLWLPRARAEVPPAA